MLRRLAALGLLFGLFSVAAVPASAGTPAPAVAPDTRAAAPTAKAAAAPKPLRLVRSSVDASLLRATEGDPVRCDGANWFNCGTATVTVVLAGLNGRERPTSPQPLLGGGGTADVTRVYGCVNADGRRIQRYTSTIVQQAGLNTRRGMPFLVPATGDRLTLTVYAFLLDAQPRGCPRGTTAQLFRITVSRVSVELESQWAPIPSATYRVAGTDTWRGRAPTPA